MTMLDLVVFLAVAIAANVVFDGFERHLPLRRRAAKLAALAAVLATIGHFAGRAAFWGVIAALTLAQIVLHAWWFPRHGVHWRTAEPRERYLALISGLKGRK
jgi:Mg/Co/Ni transporter MgtE